MSGRIMVCGIGKGMERSLARIGDLGFELVVVTDRATPAVRAAAAQVLEVDPCEPGVVDAIRRSGIKAIDGVLSLGIDNPPVIASLCRAYGCRGLDPEVARNCTEKDRRIALLRAAGIRTPRHVACSDLSGAMAAVHEIGLPVVVKPTDRTESIGVAKVERATDAAGLIGRALRASRSGRILVEEFLTGSEHTVVGLSTAGEIVITGLSDRDYAEKERFAPLFFERGDILPTRLDPASAERVRRTVRRGVSALDLAPAVFTADVLVEPSGEVVLLELAGRIPGARIATELMPLATGVDILPNALRLALGQTLEMNQLTASRDDAVVQRYLPADGRMVEWVGDIDGLSRALGLYDLYWGMPVEAGRRLPPYGSGYDLVAGVIATAPSIAEAERLADAALLRLPLRLADPEKDQRGIAAGADRT